AGVRRRHRCFGGGALATTEELTLRPVRPADRDRVIEMTRDVWDGRDYLPRVFDRWVGDAGAAFQAAEVEGGGVGGQRLRPYAPGVIRHAGLRGAAERRRAGVPRSPLGAVAAVGQECGGGRRGARRGGRARPSRAWPGPAERFASC